MNKEYAFMKKKINYYILYLIYATMNLDLVEFHLDLIKFNKNCI